MRRLQALAVLAGMVVLASCRSEPAAPPAAAAPQAAAHEEDKKATASNVLQIGPEMLRDLRVTTALVEQRPGGEGVSLLGELGVNQDRYAEVAAPIAARIVRLLATPGQRVNAGDRLAILQAGELAKARGDLDAARSRLDLARRVAERKRGLNQERITPMREVQEADAAVVSAEVEVKAAQASLSALGVRDAADAAGGGADAGDPSEFALRAPTAGIVLERLAVVGQMADPSKPLFRVADVSTLWLTVHAFERDAVRIVSGAPARITFAALPGRSFSGRASFLGRSVDPESRTVPIRIDLPNADGTLRAGMSATAWLPLGDRAGNVLAVPTAAVQRVREQWCVFLPGEAGAFEIRPVGRGRDLAGEVEILSGLRVGERIVVDGAFLLKSEVEKASGEGEHEH
jgi:cobalt-zinc-cadmium efflux system membrane fusion protein